MPEEKEKSVRLNVDVSTRVRSRMVRLKKQTDAASFAEVIRRALAVYEHMIAIDQSGGRLMIHRKNMPTVGLMLTPEAGFDA